MQSVANAHVRTELCCKSRDTGLDITNANLRSCPLTPLQPARSALFTASGEGNSFACIVCRCLVRLRLWCELGLFNGLLGERGASAFLVGLLGFGSQAAGISLGLGALCCISLSLSPPTSAIWIPETFLTSATWTSHSSLTSAS